MKNMENLKKLKEKKIAERADKIKNTISLYSGSVVKTKI